MKVYSINSDIKHVSGSSCWEAPSNIALVKYWGKHGDQLPQNSSISLTLNECKTKTSLKWVPKESVSDDIDLKLYFHGQRVENFELRMKHFFEKLQNNEMNFLNKYKLTIETQNTFPHSAGIASSASAMASVALCLTSFEKYIGFETDLFYERASHIARLGSGSASRSLYPNLAIWGNNVEIYKSNDKFAIPFEEGADVFNHFCDTILIVSSDTKSISSSVGHALMEGHPMASIRFKNANDNCVALIKFLKVGDLFNAGKIIESEALELHALMMTSNPSFILMKPGTLSIIEKVRKFRKDNDIPVFFTLDAGPNVHLLYPQENKDEVKAFILAELMDDLESGQVIFDHVGLGPKELYE